jgi:hypothetical protein
LGWEVRRYHHLKLNTSSSLGVEVEARVEAMIQTEVGEVLADTVLLQEHLAGEHPQNLH